MTDKGKGRVNRDVELADLLIVRIRDSELTDTTGVADGQVQYYLDSGTLKRKIFVRETGTWQAPS